MAPNFPHWVFIEGNKYFLLPQKAGDPATSSVAEVVGTEGYTDFILDSGQLKKGIYDPLKGFKTTPRVLGITPFLPGDPEVLAVVDGEGGKLLGWGMTNEEKDGPVDRQDPFLKVFLKKQEKGEVFFTLKTEPGATTTIFAEMPSGRVERWKQTGTENFRDVSLSLNGNETALRIVAEDKAGRKTEERLAIVRGRVFENSPWSSNRKQYLELLGSLVRAGYAVEYIPGLRFEWGTSLQELFYKTPTASIGVMLNRLWWLNNGRYRPSEERSVPLGGDPFSTLKKHEHLLLTESSLREQRSVPTNPFHVHFDFREGGLRVRIVDYLEDEVLFDHFFGVTKEGTLEGWDDGKLDVEISPKMELAVSRLFRRWSGIPFQESLANVIRPLSLPPVKTIIYRGDKTEETQKAREIWKNAAARFPEGMVLRTFPVWGKVDDGAGDGLYPWKPDFSRIGRDVKVDGNVSVIVLGKSDEQVFMDVAFGHLKEGGEPKLESLEDRHGNKISAIFWDSVLQGITIHRSPNLAKAPDAPAYRPVVADLSEFGLGELPPLFYERLLEIRQVLGEYKVYTNLDDDVFESLNPHLQTIQNEVETVEKDFGLNPGTAIQNLHFVRSQSENASVRTLFPRTIWLWSAAIPLVQQKASPIYHEAVHVIDHTYTLGPDLSFFFQEMSRQTERGDITARAFLNLVNEKNFLEKTWGGHAKENAKEFLASLLAGFQHFNKPYVQRRFSKMPSGLRNLFAEAYRKTAASIEAAFPKAPLVQKLKEAAQKLSI